ncbi:MAG: DUF58 domain-containing protein [Phycisphaerae bacterium]
MPGSRREDLFDQTFMSRLQQLAILAKRLAVHGGAGARRSRRLGDGLEFADHRGYAPGDDIRFIDWPYYARMEKLLLRLFHEHSEAEVALLLDVSGSMAAGGDAKFHYALRTAAALAYVSMSSLDRVSIVPFAEDLRERLRTGRNRRLILDVLDFLAGLESGGRSELARAADRLVRTTSAGGTVIVVSDLLDCEDQLSDALARLKLGGWDPVVVHLFSPEDADPAVRGPVLLEHAETDQKLTVDATEDVVQSYRQQWERFCEGCRRTARSRGAVYVAARTDQPFETLVLQTLRQAGVVEG